MINLLICLNMNLNCLKEHGKYMGTVLFMMKNPGTPWYCYILSWYLVLLPGYYSKLNCFKLSCRCPFFKKLPHFPLTWKSLGLYSRLYFLKMHQIAIEEIKFCVKSWIYFLNFMRIFTHGNILFRVYML